MPKSTLFEYLCTGRIDFVKLEGSNVDLCHNGGLKCKSTRDSGIAWVVRYN